ncbi:PEP-CTERM domain protein [Oopsacas minuta]|uniref:PEP-CTERM domain protein n=1 Tax=Oopsacas minuta TaxID=111878 RepID=A0AAV7JF38_9METZ|nr:PEP-CTERM domain protein [Oopsacas minuta]
MAEVREQESYGLFSQVESIRIEVRDKFSRAHILLQEREEVLLRQLREIEDTCKPQYLREIKQRKELLTTKDQLNASIKGNENKDILFAMLAPLDAKLTELEEREEYIKISWGDERELEYLIKVLGTITIPSRYQEDDEKLIVLSKPNLGYHEKSKPVHVACKYKPNTSTQPRKFKSPTAVAIYPLTRNIYISDALNNRIQVFNSSCKFLYTLSDQMNYPAGICFHNNRVYVTQFTGHVITMYTDTDGKFIESFGMEGNHELQFRSPLGICYSEDNYTLYICERENDRVQVLNSDLSFNSFIPGLIKPVDVKVSKKEIFILDRHNPCFRVYNYDNQLIREIISFGIEGSQVGKPVHFCLDILSNILLTDFKTCQVLIFTKDGREIHKFGEEGVSSGKFIAPRGIALDSEGRIVVASTNPDHCVQFF